MSSAHERIATGNQPDFDIDARDGHQYELFAADILDSLADGSSVEVKRDRRAAITGNIYLEYQAWKSGMYVKSGFNHVTAEIFTVGIGNMVAVTAHTASVRAVVRDYVIEHPESLRTQPRGSNPTKGIVIPVTEYVLRLMRSRPSS